MLASGAQVANIGWSTQFYRAACGSGVVPGIVLQDRVPSESGFSLFRDGAGLPASTEGVCNMPLYQIHEMQHAALAPMRMVAQAVHVLFSNPLLPFSYTHAAKSLVAGADLFERMTRQYLKPEFGLLTTHTDCAGTVAVHEEVVMRLPFCDLLHFARDCARKDDPKVLIIAPMSGHYATLLRGTVEAMLPDHDIYITDWINARDIPLSEGPFTLSDYVSYLRRFLAYLGPGVHTMGVCQPSVPMLAVVSLMAEDNDPNRPLSMVMMGGPIDTRCNPTEVNQFALTREISWFETKVVHAVPAGYPGRGRLVYPGFLQLSGFLSMNLERHADAHATYFGHLIRGDGDSAEKHREFYDEYLSVMDLPAEFYLETIREVFQKHSLPQGQMIIAGRPVRPEAITDVALMTVEGEKDDITGAGQTKAAHDLCCNIPERLHLHYYALKVGHYGIFNGRRWREEILPHVREFFRFAEKEQTRRRVL